MATDTHNVVRPTELVDILQGELEGILADETLSGKLPATMIWGAPGVGKSTIVKTLAKKMGLGFVDVRLAQMESIDIRGIPVPVKENKNVEWYPSAVFPKDNTKGGILFLDELSSAPKDVQVAAYELILDRQLGGGDIYKVPSKWMVVAAGNRTCDRAVSTTMSSALANRMMHLDLDVNFEDWISWAQSNDVHPSVVGFIGFKPDFLLYTKDQNLERGYPTPRSWERVSEMCKILKNETLLRKSVYGLVGVNVGQQFMEFHKLTLEMDNVRELMLDPTKTINIPRRDDLKWAMSTAMVYHIWKGENEEETKKLVDGFIRIANELPASFSTMAMLAASAGTATIPETKARMMILRNPNFKVWQKKFGKHLVEDVEV